jgi:hypothetical protein
MATNDNQSFVQQDPLINASKQALSGAETAGQDIENYPGELGKSVTGLGSDFWNTFVSPKTPAATSSSSSSGTPSSGGGLAAQESALEGNYPVAASSVANTPEAATKEQTQAEQNAQQEAAFSKTVNSKSKGAQPPTEQQDINQALAPDEAELDQIPDQYKSIIAQLQPYISSGQQTGNTALDQADANVASVVGNTDDKVVAALQGAGKGVKESAGTVPYASIVQALLGFGKYEETYAGAQPQGQADWSQSMDDIYKYLSGSSASTNGLPSPTQAAATVGSTPATSGDTAGGGNG